MRIDLSLRQLEVIVQVADAGSFRAAARQLDISQPALSRTLRLAEQTLGARLFDRDTRRVTITPAGQELLLIARRVLRDFDGAFSELGQFMQGQRGRFTVVALPSASVALLPAAVAAFREQYPLVEISLLELPAQALLAAVEDGTADFGVCNRPAAHQQLRYQPLRDDPMVLVCPAGDPLAARPSATWSVFADRPFLTVAAGSSIRQIAEEVFVRKRLSVRPALDAPSAASCCALVRAGLGITAVPELALGLADMRGLVAIPLVQPAVSRSVGVVTRIGRSLSPACASFVALLQAGAERKGRPGPPAGKS